MIKPTRQIIRQKNKQTKLQEYNEKLVNNNTASNHSF